jgi:CBS domain-containing protein
MNCPSCGHENIEGNDRCENCLAPFRDLDVPRADSAEGLARSVMEDNLIQLDQDETITVSPNTPALEVTQLMKNSNSGCALVVEEGKLIGIFTEHDVLLKMVGAGRSEKQQFVEPEITEQPFEAPGSVEAAIGAFQAATEKAAQQVFGKTAPSGADAAVKDLMTANPEVLHETDSVAEALNKMSIGRYRHIPFQKADGSYRIASIKSVLKYIAQEDW